MAPAPLAIGGYVLAGGRSSRMGQDKALLQLAGESLVARAVKKLRTVCSDVHVLGNNPALAEFAPLVPDLHPDCGPIGGVEAALAHTAFDWNLFLPVDMPFLPAPWIAGWVGECLDENTLAESAPRIHMLTVEGRPQPGLCLLHKAVLPFLSNAIALGEFKLLTAFQSAGMALDRKRGLVVHELPQSAQPNWFANLNTPDDFDKAEVSHQVLAG
jgi:molybdenum cofactor guanylyltransferase